jgi:histone-lysine N-methyltransferase SETMAR
MEFNREHIRAMIWLEWKRGLTRTQCNEELDRLLGSASPGLATIKRWYNEFIHGRESLEDEARSGRPNSATNDEMVEKVREIIAEEPHSTYRQIREQLGIGSSAVQTILHEKLKMHWVCQRLVPHFLSIEQRQNRVEICRENLRKFRRGRRFISRIITGDETYVHFYEAPTHREAKIWVYQDEIPPSKVKTEKTVRKLCYAVFFKSSGLVEAIKLDGQKTVTAKWYIDVCLPRVLEKARDLSPDTEFILHHDNARPHTAQVTRDFLREQKITILPQPPYSPDIAPCDFWLFGELKKYLRGKKFQTEEDLDSAVFSFFNSIPEDKWKEVFKRWEDRMERVINNEGDYIIHY